MTSVSPLRAWIGKEAREHTVVVLVLLALVAAVTFVPYLVFREALIHEYTDWFPAWALLACGLVLGTDLFGRDVRQGHLALMLRTPRALRGAFVAKLIVFGIALGLTLAVEEGARRVASLVTRVPVATLWFVHADGREVVEREYAPVSYLERFGLPGASWPILVALALVPWLLVGSAATRGGARSLAVVVLLAALAAPLSLMLDRHPWYVAMTPSSAVAICAGSTVLALVVAAVVWLRGRRVAWSRRPAWAFAVGLVLPIVGVSTGVVARDIERWEAPDPHVPEFRITEAHLGTGSRFLYLEAHRGFPQNLNPNPRTERGTPTRRWIVELETGRHEVSPMDGRGWIHPLERYESHASPATFSPVPWLCVYEESDASAAGGETFQHTWIETAGNRVRFASQVSGTDERVGRAVDETARATTPVRDATGRRVWISSAKVRRERSPDARSEVDGWSVPLPHLFGVKFLWDGFEVPIWDRSAADGLGRTRYVAPDGTVREMSAGAEDVRPATRVDEGHLLDLVMTSRSADSDPGEWVLVSVPSGTTRPLDGTYSGSRIPIAPGVLLRATPPSDSSPRGGLSLWRPLAGTDEPLEVPPGIVPIRILLVEGFAADGRRILEVRDGINGPNSWLSLDAKTRRVDVLVRRSTVRLRAVAVEPDGGFVVIEDERRIVRFRNRGEERTVLFPRAR